MITNKNINLQENIPVMEELFGSKNENMQMRHNRCVAVSSYFDCWLESSIERLVK